MAEHNVFGLDVSVHNAVFVEIADRLQDLSDNKSCGLFTESLVFL